MTALALVHKESILAQIMQGMRLTDIAAQYGISQPAISKVLLSDPDYQRAREIGANARLEHWESELEKIGPDDPMVMLTRAERMLGHFRWRAEREHPAIWGQTNKLQVEHLDRSDELRSAKARLIEGEIVDKSAETVDK